MDTERTYLARRQTADGKTVLLWPDGQITYALGYAIRGVGRARKPWAREADLAAGWAFMDWAEVFDACEIGTAIKAIRAAFRAPYHGRPGFRGGEPSGFYCAHMARAVEKKSRAG